MTILDRILAPTPSFYAKLRNIGLALAALSGAIITAPLALPAIIVKIAGYVAVAAGAISAVSQAVVGGPDPDNK